MKTQLLEDIGQSAELPLTPPKTIAKPASNKEVSKAATARAGVPIELRSTRGVWRDRTAAPVAAMPTLTPPAPEPAAVPVELQSVFEEIAALEAQYVPPQAQPDDSLQSKPETKVEPVVLLGELQTVFKAAPEENHHRPIPSPAEPTLPAPAMQAQATPAIPPLPIHHRASVSTAEPTLAPPATQAAQPLNDPLFDFDPPAPAPDAAEPFTRPPGFSRSRRLLFWGAALLCVATLVQGGRWLYQERIEAGSLALLASQAKGIPQANMAAAPQGADTKRVTPEADAALPDSRPASPPPPLVLLEPDQPAAATADDATPGLADRASSGETPEAEPVAEEVSAPPVVAKARTKHQSTPKPASRPVRKQIEAPARLAAKKDERKGTRQLARAPAPKAERPAPLDTSLAATLRACREHGYHATQCVKQGCSITEYGFVCRGRGRSG